MAGDDEIDDPDALLDAATHVRSTGLGIDLVYEEAARVSLESLRARFASKTTAKKTIAVIVARGLQKLLKLETERFDGAQQLVCAGPGDGEACPKGRVPPAWAMYPSAIRKRNGSAWRCRPCAHTMAAAAKTPEQRSEAARKRNAAKTSEQRSESARKRDAAKTPEQRSEAARKRNAAKTSEQRSESARKRDAAMTPEQLSERVRKASAARWSRRKPLPPTPR